MARYTDSVCRLCRREGVKLFLKGDRCFSGKCSVGKRPTPPGEHGLSRRKVSEYGMQLREKQKMRRTYGLMEKQFHSTFEAASKVRGVPTGEALLILLEMRLDNVAYRLGFGESRAQARQLLLHGHITVNGKKVNIASYRVKVGDVVAVKESSRDIAVYKALREETSKTMVKWLELNADALEGRVIAKPERSDIDFSFAEHLVVEFYSKL